MDDTYPTIKPEPIEPQPPAGTMRLEREDVFCRQCGYNLRGLTPEGKCPECGTPIERSLRGNLLVYSSPEYLTKLHQGVFLILAAIVAQIILTVLAIVLMAAVGLQGASTAGVQLVLNGLGIAVSVASWYGWWLFSSPDPAFVGLERGNAARRVVRVAVMLIAALTIAQTGMSYAVNSGTAVSTLSLALLTLVGLLSLAASATMFFASMLYMRWLTPRIPDPKLFERSKMYMWLLPILVTVGAIACGLGPLVALILYWNHFEFTRRHIKRIRQEARRDNLLA
ncbi:MAG: hypothetical protein ACF8NJ_03755 [Phycisphaerales bacterium JB038]